MTSDEIVRAFADALVALQAQERASAPPLVQVQTERLAQAPNGQVVPFHGSREHLSRLIVEIYEEREPSPGRLSLADALARAIAERSWR